jgi:very-short-patch-repair endonuclease
MPLLPEQLLGGPFTVDDARRAGLTPRQLEGAIWKRIGRATYIWKGLPDDPVHLLQAARWRLPSGAAFSGFTAAWLHGLDVAPCVPIEAIVPPDAGISNRAGIVIRRCHLGQRDIVQARGMPAVSMLRTIVDLCARLSLTEAVVIADAALHMRRVRHDQLAAWVESNPGRRGVRNFRRVLSFVEPASESPMESRLRMVLVLGGLPRPRAQVSIHDRWGRFAGRPDLYYDDRRLGIEYDGAVHRDALAADDRRQNRLLTAGVRLLRFTAADVLGNPDSVVRQVRAAIC